MRAKKYLTKINERIQTIHKLNTARVTKHHKKLNSFKEFM
jgi:hypothetical protein